MGEQPRRRIRHRYYSFIRVGPQYQACIPEFCSPKPPPKDYRLGLEYRVWTPYHNLSNDVINNYLRIAKEKYFFSNEQALAILEWNNFNLEQSYADLEKYEPYDILFSLEEESEFKRAHTEIKRKIKYDKSNPRRSQNKNFFLFNEIQKFLLTNHSIKRTVPELISYHYNTKKKQNNSSLMKNIEIEIQRKQKKFKAIKYIDQFSANDNDRKVLRYLNNQDEYNYNDEEFILDRSKNLLKSYYCKENGIEEPEINCSICDKEVRVHGKNVDIIIYSGLKLNFCSRCYLDRREDFKIEDVIGDCYYHEKGEQKILFFYDDVEKMVMGNLERADLLIKEQDVMVIDSKSNVQTRKQELSIINEQLKSFELYSNYIIPDEYLTEEYYSDGTDMSFSN